MNKKELRKELELLLVKSIETVLNKKNAAITKSIRKNTFSASKAIAKKFYKSLKEKPVPKSSPSVKVKIAVKKSAKTPVKKAKSRK